MAMDEEFLVCRRRNVSLGRLLCMSLIPMVWTTLAPLLRLAVPPLDDRKYRSVKLLKRMKTFDRWRSPDQVHFRNGLTTVPEQLALRHAALRPK